jgi:hypothetical protein
MGNIASRVTVRAVVELLENHSWQLMPLPLPTVAARDRNAR